MTKGFYNLTSGMLSQTRRLDVVANNMTNLSTSGYKSETYTDTTFDNVLMSRVNQHEKETIGDESYILAPDTLYVNYKQGNLEQTDLPLDFAIVGDGFFAVQTDAGVQYTRNGSFAVDAQGYLTLPDQGRVLGTNGQPIYLATDNITSDNYGRIFTADGTYAGQLGVYNFADTQQLSINENGMFDANGQAPEAADTQVMWKYVENSNVDMMTEMSRMLTAQRALQSAAQVLKLYDGVLTKSTTEIGRM